MDYFELKNPPLFAPKVLTVLEFPLNWIKGPPSLSPCGEGPPGNSSPCGEGPP